MVASGTKVDGSTTPPRAGPVSNVIPRSTSGPEALGDDAGAPCGTPADGSVGEPDATARELTTSSAPTAVRAAERARVVQLEVRRWAPARVSTCMRAGRRPSGYTAHYRPVREEARDERGGGTGAAAGGFYRLQRASGTGRAEVA